MEREPGSFDWGFGAGAQPTEPPAGSPPPPVGQQPAAQRPSQYPPVQPRQLPPRDDPFAQLAPVAREPQRTSWDDVSFEPEDLGFQAQEIPRRSVGRRIAGPITALVILAALGIAGTIVIDKFARDAAASVISDKVATTFGLASDDSVSVDLGGGIFIGQAFSGTIDNVAVTVPDAVFGGLEGNVGLTATGVPTSPSLPTKSLSIAVELDEESALAFAAPFATNSKATVALGDGVIDIATTLAKKPLIVSYAPTAVDGTLVLTPQSISFDGDVSTVEEFLAGDFGKAGAALGEPRSFCVADKIPAGVTLSAFAVTPTAITITAGGSGVPLVGGALTTFGSCEEQ
jgi:hypothetical protein